MARTVVLIIVAAALWMPAASFTVPMKTQNPSSSVRHISTQRLARSVRGPRSRAGLAMGIWPWESQGETEDIYQDGFKRTASEDTWVDYSGGITATQAMSCSVDEAADYADTITGYLEETARKGERVPGGAADVIQALLSHADGVQGFWTAFLTNPDLTASAKPPFDPALVATVSRFPELNIGVISNCMALSAVEEDLFEDDELMQASARASRERACMVLSALSRQPSPRKGEHGASWLLDLVNYQVLEEAASTIELRREEKRLAEARVPTCHHLASAAPLQCFEAAPRCSMGLAEVVGHSATAKARVADALAVLQEAAKREAEVLEQKKKSETEQV